MGFLAVLLGIFTFLRYSSLQLFQENLSIDLKSDIYSRFIQNDVNFFQLYKSGELISRLSNDISQAKSAISNNLTFAMRNIVTIIATIFIMLLMSWRLTTIVLLLVPIYVFVSLQYSRKAKVLIRKRQDIEAEIAVHVGEKFGGIQVIKSFSSEEHEIKKYVNFHLKLFDVNKERIFYQGINRTTGQVLPTLGSVLVLFFAGITLLYGQAELTAGKLTSFMLYCTSLSATTSGLSNGYTNIVNGASSIRKVF